MHKPALLRQHLLAAVPVLARTPENLAMYVDKGAIQSRGTGALSFAYRYTLNLVAQDFAGDVDQVTLAVLSWIARHQPDLLDRGEHQPFTFEAEVLDSGAVDLSIELELTERVLVSIDAGTGAPAIEHLDDAPVADTFPGNDPAPLARLTAEDVAGLDRVVEPAE